MNRKRELVKGLGAICVAVFLCAATAAAQEPAPASKAPAQKESASKAGSEGIKVHGHWAIEVRNADRTLASRNEFENALVPAGAVVLSALLNAEVRKTAWFLTIRGGNNDGPCLGPTGPRDCLIAQGSPSFPATTFIFPSLTINLRDQSGNYTGIVELSGNFTAAVAVPITFVQADLLLADTAGVETAYGFSARSLPVPINVAVGQQVYVTVRFSFS